MNTRDWLTILFPFIVLLSLASAVKYTIQLGVFALAGKAKQCNQASNKIFVWVGIALVTMVVHHFFLLWSY